ncbi:MAG: TonB-dependent receptor [Opitutaceae bacterium]|nr:TonB-dependent receptor [Opitutaceae bacterium]
MQIVSRSRFSRLALTASLLFGSLSAQTTQTATTPDPSAADAEEETVKLSPFEVTSERARGYISPNSVGATKIKTPLEDIPSAVIVLSRNLIDDIAPFKPMDVLKYASGVTESFDTSDRYVLRGQPSGNFYRDGFTTRFIRSDFNDVEQVEVLKGVQGVLYGSVGLAGVINLVSKTPTFQREGSVNVQVGNGDLIAGSLDYTDKLSDQSAYRAVLSAQNDQQITFDDLHNERFSAFGSVTHRFSKTVSFTGLVEYVYVDESLLGGTWFDPATGQPAQGGKYVNRNSSIAADSYFTDETIRFNGKLDMEISPDWNARLNLSHYDQEFIRNQSDSRFSPLAANGDLTRLDARYLTEGKFSDVALDITGEFTLGGLKNRLVFGAAAHRFNNDDTIWVWNTFNTNISIPENTLPRFGARAPYWFTQVATLKTYNYGAYFLNTTNFLDDKLLLVYGARYATSDQGGGLVNLGAFGDTTPVAPGERETVPDKNITRNTNSKTLYRVGLVSKPWKGVSLYASYNDTYYPSNRIAQDRNGDLKPFPPETGYVTEVGFKGEFADGQVVLNANYYWNRRGPFIYFDAAANLFKEAPATPINGFEFDLNAYLNKSWSVILTYANTKTEGVASYAVPRYSWSAWTKYDFSAGGKTGLSVGLGVDYMTDRTLFISPLRGDARTLLAAMVTYRVSDRWSFALNGSNLTDEFFVMYDTGGYDAVVPGEPRRIKLSTTYKF